MTYEEYEQIRIQKGIKTNAEVAKKAGIPASTFTDWKKRKSSPKVEKLEKIKNALGISEEQIYVPSANDLQLIEDFNSLDEESQRQLILMIAFLKEQNKK